MDKSGLYIQKLIALLLVTLLGVVFIHVVNIYYLLPAMFFTLAVLVSRITGQKPEFLFGTLKSEEFLSNKAGFWVLFKWILVLFGLIYDFVAWIIFGVYILFMLIVDLILLVKTILFWIVYAILWFLKLFVPAIVFTYKIFIHYVFRWNWWIYRLSFTNLKTSVNTNFYFVSLWGAVIMLFILFLFYGVGVLIGVPEIIALGAVFSVLPLVWSYGEISAIRFRNTESESFQQIRNGFNSGFEAIKAVLQYFVVFLILAITEVVFNVLGWIPQIGFSFLGLALNINTLASLVLIFLLVILVFAKLIMPAHIVYNKNFRPDFNGSLNFLGVIGKRFLRYIISVIPTSIFASFLLIIPAFIVFLSIILTLNVKNSILDTRETILQNRIKVLEGIPQYELVKDIQRIRYYKDFPKNVLTDFRGMKSLNKEIQHLTKNFEKGEKETTTLRSEFSSMIDSLDKKIETLKSLPMVDSISKVQLTQIETLRHSRIDDFTKWEQEAELSLNKMKVDISDKKGFMVQLPIVFLFTIIWLSIFLGLVVAYIISYLGNVYFELYNIKEDNKPTYFSQLISEINAHNRNQPLLGFTLLVLLIGFFYLLSAYGIIELFLQGGCLF